MAKEEHIELTGEVVQCGMGGIFKVECEGGHLVTAKLGGKMRKFKIRVVLGDEVTVAVSPYDFSRGMITFRKK
jgi:translation initiation factor IF-1